MQNQGATPLQATTLLWHVTFSGFAVPFSWPKKLLSKLISTLKSTEFICQLHAEFCFIWRFCVHAEKHYGILKGFLEVKSEGIYWKWGRQGNLNRIEWIRELEVECCLLLPKSPSADWYRCVCLCVSVCVFLEQQCSLSFFVDQMQRTESSNHITTRWKLFSQNSSLLHLQSRRDPSAGAAGGPQVRGRHFLIRAGGLLESLGAQVPPQCAFPEHSSPLLINSEGWHCLSWLVFALNFIEMGHWKLITSCLDSDFDFCSAASKINSS